MQQIKVTYLENLAERPHQSEYNETLYYDYAVGKYCIEDDVNGIEVDSINLLPSNTAHLKRLRIRRYLDYTRDPLTTDFSIVGLKKVSPKYDKGRKSSADYTSPETDELVVRKIFKDVKDENNNLIGLQIDFYWYSEDGFVALEKSEIAKYYNKYEAETVLRKRRERQIDYLIAGSKNTPIEAYLHQIFQHYKEQIAEYKNTGLNFLRDAILNETDLTILSLLDIDIPLENNTTIKVRDSILYQITPTSEEN